MSGLHHLAAHHLATKGRGPDTMLVHMAPSEVNSLRGLAQNFGGDLSINPETGLHEAGFLSSILPTVLGAALTATGVGAPIAAAMVGLGTGAITGDIKQGLMAGLGAFGGASLGAAAGLGKAGAQAGLQSAATSALPGALPADAGALLGSNASLATQAAGAALPGAAGAAAPGALGAAGAGTGVLTGAGAGAGAGLPSIANPSLLGAGAGGAGAGGAGAGGAGLGTILPPTPPPPPVAPPPAATGSLLNPTDAANIAKAAGPLPPGAPTPPQGFMGKFADAANKGTHLSKSITTPAAMAGLAAPLMQTPKGEEPDEKGTVTYNGPARLENRSVIGKPTDGPLSSSEHMWFDDANPGLVAGTGSTYTPPKKKASKFAEGGAVGPGSKGAQQQQQQQKAQPSPGGKGAQSPAQAGGAPPSGDQQGQMSAYTNLLAQQQGAPGAGSQSASLTPYTPTDADGMKSSQAANLAAQSGAALGGQQGGDPNALPIGGAPSNPYASQAQQPSKGSMAYGAQRGQMASPGGKGAQGAPKQQAAPGGKGAQSGAPKTFARGGTVNLKEGAFVLDARTVSEIGNGSSSAGLEVLKKRLGAKHLKGKGNGVSDDIPARIGNHPARVARDEAYIPPEHVARLGGGDPKKGAQKLYQLMDHAHRTRRNAKPGQDTRLAGRL